MEFIPDAKANVLWVHHINQGKQPHSRFRTLDWEFEISLGESGEKGGNTAFGPLDWKVATRGETPSGGKKEETKN